MRSLEIDTDSALRLPGPGVSADRLLLYGEDEGRVWYVSAVVSAISPKADCYGVSVAAAFDAADAVVLVFAEWQEVGLRLPKRGDFVVPPGALSSENGRYLIGESGQGTLCVDPDGFVFGLP